MEIINGKAVYPKWKMAGFTREHYHDEHMRHKEFYALKYSNLKVAERILKKIAKHFKMGGISLEFSDRMRGGLAYAHDKFIKMSVENASLGMICHELAHILCYQKYMTCENHNRKFQRQCDRVCNWAKRYLPSAKPAYAYVPKHPFTVEINTNEDSTVAIGSYKEKKWQAKFDKTWHVIGKFSAPEKRFIAKQIRKELAKQGK